jgi:hypothetical protein
MVERRIAVTSQIIDAPSNSYEGGESFSPLEATGMILNGTEGGGSRLWCKDSKMARTSVSESRRIVAMVNAALLVGNGFMIQAAFLSNSDQHGLHKLSCSTIF